MLLPDAVAFPPKEIAGFLLKAGVDEKTPVFVCENIALPNEKIISNTLAQVSKLAFVPLCVMVIKANR
jgi:precorrin-6B methylase 1